MYITNFVCTYKLFEDIEDDEVNSDMLYQAQFLQVFGITEYNDTAISAGLELIKATADKVPELKALILQHPHGNGNDTTPNFDELLPLMFAYPLLDVFHLCLIDAVVTGSVSPACQDRVLHVYSSL
jgi:hypothetical protein